MAGTDSERFEEAYTALKTMQGQPHRFRTDGRTFKIELLSGIIRNPFVDPEEHFARYIGLVYRTYRLQSQVALETQWLRLIEQPDSTILAHSAYNPPTRSNRWTLPLLPATEIPEQSQDIAKKSAFFLVEQVLAQAIFRGEAAA